MRLKREHPATQCRGWALERSSQRAVRLEVMCVV
jgi:hypothetical protein